MGDEKNGERVKIIGPHSSDILKDMVREARGHDINKWPDLKKVQFYVYGASAPDRQLLNKTSDTVRTGDVPIIVEIEEAALLASSL